MQPYGRIDERAGRILSGPLRDGPLQLDATTIADIERRFAKPVYEKLPADSPEVALLRFKDKAFGRWLAGPASEHAATASH